MTVRVRFAPAPSGSLHVGNVRTALFNWLFVRHAGGQFVLRVEDTDKARVTEEAYLAALEDLKWLGLSWDEGPEAGGPHAPYRQSERAQRHEDGGLQLLESGAAYRCFCTPDELDARRKQALAEGRKPGYDGRCYRLTDDERRKMLSEGRPWAVRFHVPDEGELHFTDLVVGDVTVGFDQIDDFVIMRSDGSTLYQLAVVVDDMDMQITHVIRGDDHLSNVPKQILLHQALGNEVPVFGHVPQVLGDDRKPLSKRKHSYASVDYFRNAGYLPEALFNYLALLGWGTAEDTIMDRQELISRFRIEDVHPSPAMFDFKKLDWMNGEYVRALDDSDLAKRIEPWLARAGLVGVPATTEHRDEIAKIVPLIKTRIKKLDEAPAYAKPFFTDVTMDEAAFEKVMRQEHVPSMLKTAIADLRDLEPWDAERVEEALRKIQTDMELKPKTAFMPFYVAITGSTVGAPIFDAIAILGKGIVLERLEAALGALSSG